MAWEWDQDLVWVDQVEWDLEDQAWDQEAWVREVQWEGQWVQAAWEWAQVLEWVVLATVPVPTWVRARVWVSLAWVDQVWALEALTAAETWE